MIAMLYCCECMSVVTVGHAHVLPRCTADEPDRKHWYSNTQFAEIWRALIQKNPFYATSEQKAVVHAFAACAHLAAEHGTCCTQPAQCREAPSVGSWHR